MTPYEFRASVERICMRSLSPEDHEGEYEPPPPDADDACMVCDRIECVCAPEA